MNKKLDAKEIGLMFLLGAGVMVFTPMINGLWNSISLMGTDLFLGLTLGELLAAGAAAFGMDFVITKYMRK